MLIFFCPPSPPQRYEIGVYLFSAVIGPKLGL